MARAKKATDPSAPKTTRSRKSVAVSTESTQPKSNQPVEITAKSGSTEELIRQRAYELFLERRGNGDGSPEEDWFRAESEILGRSA